MRREARPPQAAVKKGIFSANQISLDDYEYDGHHLLYPQCSAPRQLPHPRPRHLSWIFTLDHKRIGVMYLVGVLGRLPPRRHLRPARPHANATARRHPVPPPAPTPKPGKSIGTYNQMFTLARRGDDLPVPHSPAFPRPRQFRSADHAGRKGRGLPPPESFAAITSILSARCSAITSIVCGGVDTGWTFYTPYSAETTGAVSLMAFGGLRAGLQLDLHGHQLHRHHAQAPRPAA